MTPAPTVADLLAGDRLTFGVTAPRTAEGVVAMDAIGVESYWVGGHVASRNPSPEAVVHLAMLAARTERPIGTAILLLPLYPPAIVAKQFADLDVATDGRVVLGVGVGGEYPQEFRATLVPIEERGRRTDEAIPLIRRLWTGDELSHDGPFFSMRDVRIHPAPRQPDGPPIIVSGRQVAAMRRAATLGDGWMPYMYSHRRYRESVGRIHELADAAGRTLDRFGWMAYVPVCIDDDGDAARATPPRSSAAPTSRTSRAWCAASAPPARSGRSPSASPATSRREPAT